jgi:hypothetical protein
MLYHQSYYFRNTLCVGSVYIRNAVLPYLQTSAISHPTRLQLHNILHSQYLKPQNLTCLLSALHQFPQYCFKRS